MVADYQNLDLSLDYHPMALLRQHPELRHCYPAGQLSTVPHKRFITIAGLVTNRQRPATAGGVIFMTLEDESGLINVILWKSVVEAQRRVLLGSQLLKIKGALERHDGVTHVIAGRLIDCSHLLADIDVKSRNFR
jgi:error-prone DNA polymerase